MIKIGPKGAAPDILTSRGAALAAAHCAAYDLEPAAYQVSRKAGGKEFGFDDKVYAHSTVKGALERVQHGKCCYCEVFIPKPYAFGHVEHWRPKSWSQQAKGSPQIRPGYYWMAYDWDNLFLSCTFCNSSNKGNQFPLEAANARARDHHHRVSVERPLLLRSDGPDDPRDHIGFRRETPFGRTPEGRKTVEVLGLDRIDHVKRQRKLAKLIVYHNKIVKHHGDRSPLAAEVVGEARAAWAAAIQPDAPFSAMALAYLEAHPLP